MSGLDLFGASNNGIVASFSKSSRADLAIFGFRDFWESCKGGPLEVPEICFRISKGNWKFLDEKKMNDFLGVGGWCRCVRGVE